MKLHYTLLLLMYPIFMMGQSSSVANRYFNEYAYVKASSMYEEIVKKDSSQVNLERLGDSYYNIRNTQASAPVYAALLKDYEKQVAPTYYFKYAQSLKSNGEDALATTWFEKFFNAIENDQRAQRFLEGITTVNKSKIPVAENIKLSNINTEYSDFTGFIQKDTLYWFSTRNTTGSKTYQWNSQPYLDVFASKISPEGTINPALEANFLTDINTKYHEATLCITKDGKTMFFTRDNYDGRKLGKDKEKTTHLKLYKASYVDGRWEDITELPINSDAYSVGHPALNADESKLYFVSDMPGSLGNTDLYQVNIVNGNVSEQTVKSLGDHINTEGDEMFPFIDADNNLYFSSNGHPGYGLLDVFVASPVGDRYDTVENMGRSINSNRDDFGFIAKDGFGFMGSNRENGIGDDDIYRFDFNKCAKTLQGIVYDERTKEPLPDATIRLIDTNGEQYATITSGSDGSYSFENIDCFPSIVVTGDKQDYRPAKVDVTLAEALTTQDLYLTNLIVDDQIVLKPIYFDFDKSDIRPDAAYELENIITVMTNHPTMVIAIESHTDSRGPDEYNRLLSDRRAKSTRDYLYSRGLARERIQSAIGYGESQLLNGCSNGVRCSKEEHQLNRRSVFRIVK
ncbi:OmpA family protein [Joostella atrarenae]|uniref:OmpA family protein n=1 Tax=Joostella atrarenae TaxID=679257 RepID=A0ABS9J408_9FLAO|nr:OmpA family protein [Joostella atrarenae]MCF8715162.1 OmpA family protein [Joostella atrarenae]